MQKKLYQHRRSVQVIFLFLFSISFFRCILICENIVEQEKNFGEDGSEDGYDDEYEYNHYNINLKRPYDDYDDEDDLITAGEGGGGGTHGMMEDVYDAHYFESGEAAGMDLSFEQDKVYHYHHYGKNGTKVIFGLVACRNGTNSNYLAQTVLLIKSILISAEMYNVNRVEFHVFLENTEDEKYFLESLEEMGYPSGYEQVDMDFIVHSAVEIIPVKYRRQMAFQRRHRCGYTKFFYPTALPKVGAIIHLDVSMLVTGSILKIWELLSEMNDDHKVIGVLKNIVPEENRQFMDADKFGDSPQLLPKGANSGVLLMNLTRMRAYKWEEKFTRAYSDYSKITRLNPQKVLNILLFYNPALLFPIPCNFNFLSSNCNAGHSCKSAQEDNHGIQIIQANHNYNFENQRVPFHPLLRYYHVYNMTKKGRDPMKDLMIPIRTAYDRKSKMSKCYGKINKLLFKNFFK